MAMVKVIYFDQTAGKVEHSRINDLIGKGKIAVYCSSGGWVNTMSEQVSGIAVEQEN